MAESIFKFGDKFGYESPFGDWLVKRNSKNNKIKEEGRVDFLPIVNINRIYPLRNALITPTDCSYNGYFIELSKDYSEVFRAYPVYTIYVKKGTKAYIPMKNEAGYSTHIGSPDEDGILTFSATQKGVKLNLLAANNPNKLRENTPKYNAQKAKVKDEYILELTANISYGEEFRILATATDDKDDGYFGTKSDKKTTCCYIKVKVVNKDVFLQEEFDELLREIEWIAPFADDEFPIEYATNYCMQAADRALSKLFNNTLKFYAVDRNHNRLSKVSFAEKTAANRATELHKLGYVKNSFSFDDYVRQQEYIDKIVDEDTFGEYLYDVLKMRNEQRFFQYFDKAINNNLGYHIFYLSVTDNYHTLILVIDNSNPCKSMYTIYDQHGRTSSYGDYKEITEGVLRQTCWTFSSWYLNKGSVKGRYPKTITRIWKLKRNS